MRVLSFIPAFVLAAASFVAAAPTSSAVSIPSVPSVPSCVTGGSGNDGALQPIISIIANATVELQGLSGQLSGMQNDPSSCTSDAITSIVVDITAVVDTCITQLQAAVQVDITGLDLTDICVAISALVQVCLSIVTILVSICISVGASVIVSVQACISTLLNAILSLVACLQVYIDVSVTISATVSALISALCGAINLCLNIFLGISVSL